MRTLVRSLLSSPRARSAVFGGALLWLGAGFGWPLVRPLLYKDLLNQYAGVYKFDPLWAMSLVAAESGFSRTALSHRGAIGLMQLRPATARDMAERLGMTDFRPDHLRDPRTNIRLGFLYLDYLRSLFGREDEIAILAAYNAGPAAAQTWRTPGAALSAEQIPYGETRRFVRKVRRNYRILKILQSILPAAAFHAHAAS